MSLAKGMAQCSFKGMGIRNCWHVKPFEIIYQELWGVAYCPYENAKINFCVVSILSVAQIKPGQRIRYKFFNEKIKHFAFFSAKLSAINKIAPVLVFMLITRVRITA